MYARRDKYISMTYRLFYRISENVISIYIISKNVILPQDKTTVSSLDSIYRGIKWVTVAALLLNYQCLLNR